VSNTNLRFAIHVCMHTWTYVKHNNSTGTKWWNWQLFWWIHTEHGLKH